jgi:acetyltransferase-like isoleucine patch superfamily enzyme
MAPEGSVTSGGELLAELRALHAERRREIRERFARDLPFAEQVVDRWERATALGFGEEASIYDSAIVIGDVSVGKRTWIGPWTLLDGSGGLKIGDNCSISAGVQIYTHDSVRWALSNGAVEYERSPVSIGSQTYIGPGTIVARGVAIGSHCLVGANSVVNKNVPDYSIAWGSTCRIVGRVEVGPGGLVAMHYFDDSGSKHG